MKARRRRPNPCRDLERLERRELLSQGATPVLGGDPFANSTTDNPAAQTGTLYPDSQVEPDIVVNPTRPNNVVALWQQDRWSNGGAHGIVVAVSSNGGNHWTQVVLPGVSKVSGGEYDRVSNAWMSFAPTAPSTSRRSPSTSTRITPTRSTPTARRSTSVSPPTADTPGAPDDDHQRPEPGRGPQRRPGAGLQRQGHGDRRPDPARLRVRRLGPDRRGPGDRRLHGPGLFLHDDRRRPHLVDARGDLHAAGRRRPWTTRTSSCPTARWWTCSARGRSPAGRST